jgi:aspartate/methionine/tyrosine aminotransferase
MQLKPFLLTYGSTSTNTHRLQPRCEHRTDLDGKRDPRPCRRRTRHRFLNHKLVYSRPAGADSLREAIAEMQHVSIEAVQIVTGASEALLALMWLAAEPGANVIIPLPGFTTFSALPESLGLETRFYRVRRENGFRIDPDEIMRLADSKTKLILVNSPHNPTGATIGDGEMQALHDFTAECGIQLVSDEVYHPIYHGRQTKSAARLPHATVIADLSKAFSIAGVRTGWMIEHDAKRRQQYWTARLLLHLQHHHGRDSLGDRNSQT